MRARAGRLAFAAGLAAAVAFAAVRPAAAQDPRLERLPDAARAPVDSLVGSAHAQGLPTEPLIDRALEGVTKGADARAIVLAVRRLSGELATAREALGRQSDPAELVAGASALRAGAAPDDLAQLRQIRPTQSLIVPAAVLADLVAVGVPPDTAVGAVLALATSAADAQYVAFRRNVERDIELGASPVAALGVRLDRFTEIQTLSPAAPGSSGAPSPRKP